MVTAKCWTPAQKSFLPASRCYENYLTPHFTLSSIHNESAPATSVWFAGGNQVNGIKLRRKIHVKNFKLAWSCSELILINPRRRIVLNNMTVLLDYT